MAGPVYKSMIDPPATYDLDVLRAFLERMEEMRAEDPSDDSPLYAIKETKALIAIVERADAEIERERHHDAA